ncbi:MAG: Spy/CpxP family protein refolding chaperone [Xanthobacteraceae bacterium]
MIKPIIAATALFALAGSTLVYAQQNFAGHNGDGSRLEYRHRPNPTDIAAFTDARIAALKAGLELTPDQAKDWPPFEQALRDMAQLRIQRIQAHLSGQAQAPAPATPFDRLERRADAMAKRSGALKKVADAGAPLYQSLNDDQKQRFMVLARMLRPHRRMHAMLQHRWREGEGYGWRDQRSLGQQDFGQQGFGQQGFRGQDFGPRGSGQQDGGAADQGSQL